MNKHRVIRQRIVSPDGKAIAEATSRVVISDNNQTEINQSVSVRVTQTSSYSSSSSSSTSSSRSRTN
ncbi:MAG: hypothetical protein AAF298_10880 [Cyanobacteria bacterium P01_A01_bin.40]